MEDDLYLTEEEFEIVLDWLKNGGPQPSEEFKRQIKKAQELGKKELHPFL